MPSRLEKRLTECNTRIDDLFRGVSLNAEIEKQLKQIKKYYRRLYIDADAYEEETCIELYELFVTDLEYVKEGKLKPEEALEKIDEIKSLRKAGILLDNLLNSLALLFWATATCTYLAVSVLIAPPMAATNPLLAWALLASACALLASSVVRFFDCIDKFKSSIPIEEQYGREKSLIFFFKPAELSAPLSSEVPENTQTEQQQERLYPALAAH